MEQNSKPSTHLWLITLHKATNAEDSVVDTAALLDFAFVVGTVLWDFGLIEGWVDRVDVFGKDVNFVEKVVFYLIKTALCEVDVERVVFEEVECYDIFEA